MSQENNRILLDTTTGEVLAEFKENDRLKLSRAEQDEYLKSHIIDFNRDKSFVKVYDEVVPLLEKYLTMPEFKLAICLMPHVSYEDCIIRETKDRRSKILSIKDLAEIHDWKYDYLRKIISSLKKKGVIGKHETGNILYGYNGRYGTVYTVNPFIYFRGSDMITPVYSFYVNSGWQELIKENCGS